MVTPSEQGHVERAFSRQRRLSSRRGLATGLKDMPARERAWPPGRPLHASQPMSMPSIDARCGELLCRLLSAGLKNLPAAGDPLLATEHMRADVDQAR